MGLSPKMMAALLAAEYLDPTPIQAGLVPRALAGVDVMGQAQTGTGKTAAFAIPILEHLKPHHRGEGPQAIILVPTRELAVQVRDECASWPPAATYTLSPCMVGNRCGSKWSNWRKGPAVVVGTPGRVLDLIGRGALVLSGIRTLVLDEADRMLDIGFRPDIEKILRRCPASRQTLLLSATIPPPVKRLAERYMRTPRPWISPPRTLAVETIEQFYFTVDSEQKFDLLATVDGA